MVSSCGQFFVLRRGDFGGKPDHLLTAGALIRAALLRRRIILRSQFDQR